MKKVKINTELLGYPFLMVVVDEHHKVRGRFVAKELKDVLTVRRRVAAKVNSDGQDLILETHQLTADSSGDYLVNGQFFVDNSSLLNRVSFLMDATNAARFLAPDVEECYEVEATVGPSWDESINVDLFLNRQQAEELFYTLSISELTLDCTFYHCFKVVGQKQCLVRETVKYLE